VARAKKTGSVQKQEFGAGMTPPGPDLVSHKRNKGPEVRGPNGVRTILIADDEPAVRLLIRGLLETGGYGVLEAGDGNAALRIMENTPVDLLITDLCMPERGGWETILEVHRLGAPSKILVVSGSLDEFLPGPGDFRVDAILEKPFRSGELVACVHRLLPDA
jgi:CheY-like chemotaxis protein